ncbi:MAG: MlaD family protein, partial [Candidatus Binatia bacterium]
LLGESYDRSQDQQAVIQKPSQISSEHCECLSSGIRVFHLNKHAFSPTRLRDDPFKLRDFTGQAQGHAMPSDENYSRTEISAGLLVFIGVLYLLYVAIGLLGNGNVLGTSGYVIYADFVSASGLHAGDPLEIAGVEIGTVESISLADYRARVSLRINENVRIHEDAIASIEQDWLIGNSTISIDPGASAKILGPGDEIEQTWSPPSLQYLVGKLLAGDLVSAK